MHNKSHNATSGFFAPEELAALRDISRDLEKVRKPHLPKRYWLCTGFVLAIACTFGIWAIAAPRFVTEYLLLSHSENMQWFTTMTRVRGIAALCLCVLFGVFRMKSARSVDILVFIALLWTSTMTVADLYKLYVLGVFQSSFGSSLWLLLRPIIFLSLAYMTLAGRRYRRALEAWKLQVSD